MEVIVRPYQQGDEESIVELLKLVFDGWPHFDLECTPLDHWRWKYLENPLKMKAIAVGISDRKVIGCNHGYYLRLKLGTKTILCQQGMDLAVHPDCRGLGVWQRLTDLKQTLHKENKTNLTYSISANPIVNRRSLQKGRPQFPHPLQHLIRIRDIDLFLRKKKSGMKFPKKYGYHFVKLLKRIENISIQSSLKSEAVPEFQISEIVKFDDRIDELWRTTRDHYNFIVERDREYLNWRYCDHRGGSYIIKQAEQDSLVLGYAILRINRYKKDWPEGYVVDLLTSQDRPYVAQALLSDAISYFNDQDINVIHYWAVKNHPHERLFKLNMFLNTRDKIIIIYNPMNVGKELEEFQASSADKLHFQLSDTDWI